MWPTRAPGTTVSMPSRMPVPARRIDTNTSFLPSITIAFVVSSGGCTSISRIGVSRVTSYVMSIASSLSSRRKEFVDASLLRISVSLCWMSGCMRTWTLFMSGILSPLEHRPVADDPQRRQPASMLFRERTARGPRPAFEHLGQRQVHVHLLAPRVGHFVHLSDRQR